MASTQSLLGVGANMARALERLGCKTVLSLLWHLPYSAQKRHFVSSLNQAIPGELITFQAEVLQHFPAIERFKTASRRPYRVAVGDHSRFLDLVFFNAIPSYIEKNLPVGETRVISGKFENYQGKFQMTHPDHIGSLETLKDWQGVEPIYALTQGISQKQLRKMILLALEKVQPLPEWISAETLQIHHWRSWHEALRKAHFPSHESESLSSHGDRKRLAFDELFANQLALTIVRRAQTYQNGQQTFPTHVLQQKILDTLPFKLTRDQLNALEEIEQDMKSPHRMVRLLQGDVGSGKTIVAFLSMVKAVEAGFQAALLAPTEILAKQHAQTMMSWAEAAGITLDVLLGKDSVKIKKEKYERLKSGSLQIIVGTHALVQEAVSFHNLGFIVVDEQHRFGVEQRLKLAEKGQHVDVLSMTATPIPRTLMLATYGDLACSYLHEKPAGRQEVQTKAIPLNRVEEIFQGITRVVQKGAKVYWICPLVEESEVLDLAAAEDRFHLLEKKFPGITGLLHGRLKSQEKDKIMEQFKEIDLQILVATTVVEVGVHVEDATIMVIEHAERFGLSQLHQLRGRIGRGSQSSSCVLLYQTPLNEIAKARINVLRSTTDGFKIAEEDLRLRGGGDALGLRQSGMPNFYLVDFTIHKDLFLLAQQESDALLAQDPMLASPRGQAARLLLALFGKESAMRFLQAG